MKKRRFVYQDWIVQLGRDPDVLPDPGLAEAGLGVADIVSMSDPRAAAIDSAEADRVGRASDEVVEAVERALGVLTKQEQEFVRQYYYRGLGFREMGELTGRDVNRLKSEHKRIQRRLRQLLGGLVRRRYGIAVERVKACPVCDYVGRETVDRLIAEKGPGQTWGPLLCLLRKEFGLRIGSAQTLIGHQKYHGRMESECVDFEQPVMQWKGDRYE